MSTVAQLSIQRNVFEGREQKRLEEHRHTHTNSKYRPFKQTWAKRPTTQTQHEEELAQVTPTWVLTWPNRNTGSSASSKL